MISIGDGAFYGCLSLQQIAIPSSVTSIGEKVFNGTDLKQISFLASVKKILPFTFYGCPFVQITIPSSVTSIGNNAFERYLNLTKVEIPLSVTSIGDFAFQHCISLPKISIPSSVLSIGKGVFNGCTSLMEITIPSSFNAHEIGVNSSVKVYASRYHT